MAIEVFVRCLAKLARTMSGDAFWYAETGRRVWIAVADGLGSGPEAARASRAAIDCLRTLVLNPSESDETTSLLAPRQVEHLIMACDRALCGTRGAALGLALLDAGAREGHYAAIGNIEMRLIGQMSKHPVGTPGIVGAGVRKIRVQTFPYVPGDLVLLHSDGLSSHFDLDETLANARSLEALGEALVRDQGHAHDDLTLLLLRQHSPP